MADKTIAWIQRQKSIHPEKPWIAYYAPNGHKPPVGVPSEFIEKYRGKFDDGYDKLRERILARQKELGIVPADTKLAPRPAAHAGVGRAQRHRQEGRRPLDGGLLRRGRAHRLPGRPHRRGHRADGRARQHADHLHRRRQRPDARGRPARHHEQAELLQRRPGVARGRGEADRRLRRPEVARLLSRRLGLRHVHAVHLRQDGDLGRRLQHGRGDLLAGAHQGPGRHPPRSSIISSTWPRPSWSASACRSRSGSTASTRSRWKA